jgi:hypothetical protein
MTLNLNVYTVDLQILLEKGIQQKIQYIQLCVSMRFVNLCHAISLDLSLYTINALSKSTPIPDLYRFNSFRLSPMKMGEGGGVF